MADRGEIDIMENRGDQPTITSSAFHWGTRDRDPTQYFGIEQQTAIGEDLVRTPMDFTRSPASGSGTSFGSMSTTCTMGRSTTTN